MKKIATLFVKEYKENHSYICREEIRPGMEPVLEGNAVPTVKYDGTACAVINGKFYIRYDAKKGRKAPLGGIPCVSEPDPVTGHWPFWIEAEAGNGQAKWQLEALENWKKEHGKMPEDGTYEAVGPKIRDNRYGLERHELIRHGAHIITDLKDFSYEGIRKWISEHNEEGIVFWYKGEPAAKIRRKDFGLKFPMEETEKNNGRD